MNSENSFADIINTATNVLEIEANSILLAKERIGASFVEAVNLSLTAIRQGRIILMGVGKSGHIAKKISATLASTGAPSFFIQTAEAVHGDLGMIKNQDIVIIISNSGCGDEMETVLPFLKRNNIKLIAFTSSRDSLLRSYCDIWIDTSIEKEACPLGLAPTASTALSLALGDALAMSILKCQGITSEMFAQTHPHGALGRKLLVKVDDIMVRDEEIPIAANEITVREAILIMTKTGMGFVCIIDKYCKIIGIFTDGDLRRLLNLNVDINNTNIASVMNTKFQVVQLGKLAAEAANVMELNKISCLPVVSIDNQIVGAINTRILLQSGVL